MPPEVIQILPIVTITSILLLIIQTATLAQSIYLLSSHWCLASQTTAQLVLKEVLSTTIWSICLRGSITIQLCRELKMEPERKLQMDLNKMVLLWWKTCYSFSYTATTLDLQSCNFQGHKGWSSAVSCPIRALNLGSCSQYRSKWSQWNSRIPSGVFWITDLQWLLKKVKGQNCSTKKRWSQILPSSEKSDVSHLAKD